MHEIYEETLLNTDAGTPPAHQRILKAHVSMGKAYRGLTIRPEADGDEVPGESGLVRIIIGDEGASVKMADVTTSWLKMQKILGLPFVTTEVIPDAEKEQIAGIVEAACEKIPDAEATDLRAGMLRLLYAADQRVPMATVDPEDFDGPIQTLREKLVESSSPQEEEYLEAVIEGVQMARENVLGKSASHDGHERDVELRHG